MFRQPQLLEGREKGRGVFSELRLRTFLAICSCGMAGYYMKT